VTSLFFGMQQFLEDIVGLTTHNTQQHDTFLIAKSCYLFFATVLWPEWFAFIYLIVKQNLPLYTNTKAREKQNI